MNEEELRHLVDEYVSHDGHRRMLDKMVSDIKSALKEAIETHGTPDDRGHKWLQIGKWQLQLQKRQGEPTLDKEAVEEWAKAKGFWEEVSDTIEVVNEDKLMAYMYENKDDEELENQLQSLYTKPKPSYAFQPPMEDKYNDY